MFCAFAAWKIFLGNMMLSLSWARRSKKLCGSAWSSNSKQPRMQRPQQLPRQLSLPLRHPSSRSQPQKLHQQLWLRPSQMPAVRLSPWQQQQQQMGMSCTQRARPNLRQMKLVQPLQKLQMPQQLLRQLPMQQQQQQQQQCPMATSSLMRCQRLRPGTLTWQMQMWRPLQVCWDSSHIRATLQYCVLTTDMTCSCSIHLLVVP